MTKKVKRARTPSPITGTKPQKGVGVQQSQAALFVSMALDMTWRLAIVVIIPIVGGFMLDQHLKTSPAFSIAGFFIAMAGTAVVLWQTMKTANSLPVPKLTAAQKRAVKKSYEEDDE